MDDIKRLLSELCCFSYYTGFNYLKDITTMACGDEAVLRNLSVNAYPKIANKYSAAPTAVEHAIRTVIKRAWTENPDKICEIAGRKLNAQPTIKDFIHIVACHFEYFRDD